MGAGRSFAATRNREDGFTNDTAKQSATVSVSERHPRASAKSNRTESWLSIWKYELLSVATSVAFMVLNFSVLISINGKPLTSWRVLNVHITPNALISIISTLSKASMLFPVSEGISQLKWIFFQRSAHGHALSYVEIFDNASRGPLGALNSLWRLRFRDLLTSVGALVTILALAIEPFTQQILAYPTQPVNGTNVTTSIRKVTSLNHDFSFNPGILQGIFAPSTLNTYSCPTSDCSWPSFKTLGVCSKCTDHDPVLEISCETDRGNATSAGQRRCTVLAKGPPLFTLNYVQGDVGWGMTNNPKAPWYGQYGDDIWLTAATENSGIDISGFAELLTFSFLRAETIVHHSTDDGKPAANPSATTCSFFLCEQAQPRSHFSDGSLQTSAISSERLDFADCTFLSPAAYRHGTCPGVPISQSAKAGNFSKSILTDSNLDIYTVDPSAPSRLLSSITATLMSGEGVDASLQKPISGSTYSAFSTVFSKNVTQMMESITTGLNLQLRQSAKSTAVQGQAFIPVVFVRVRWPWFAYPVAIVLLAVVFWISTVVCSHCRDGDFVWKSSSLALLFHGLSGWDVDTLGASERTRDIKDAAANMRARLSRDHVGNVGFIRS